ncbi:uncharacterized protein LOC125757430 [Rhipicephalus sanguineus]|uniref:uncharacterized protein LOC125757430 n=1 Tax=Rhipicephalus sanguineus TaxID=34632 RepID=UPI0020C3DD73|nr:uncharacterized protein LOC125757430 [Rhipicephalus sanguineus]
MTDNSAAEKAALQQTWPTVRQLLCHFHVTQAEWRWLTASRNNVEKTQRRQLMNCYMQVMYADSEEKLEGAIAQLLSQPHPAFVARAEAFLQRQEEWVLLFRSSATTHGHSTNNVAEATIRVLKDIVLSRAEAFNVVALVDAISTVWEKYFECRILRHVYSRVASHQLSYKRSLSRMPAGTADSIKLLDNGLYAVPSSTNSATYYEMSADVGACACPAGIQGAFCKHQALVHERFGGLFPNAPVLTTDDHYQLGQLAIGDKCPPKNFFTPFLEADYTCDTQVVMCDPGPSTACQRPSKVATGLVSPASAPNIDDAQLSQDRETVYMSLETSLRCLHAMNAHNVAYLDIVKGLTGQLELIPNGNDATGAMLATKATVAAQRRSEELVHVERSVTCMQFLAQQNEKQLTSSVLFETPGLLRPEAADKVVQLDVTLANGNAPSA